MAKFTVASPSGKEYVVEAPNNASDSEILEYARNQLGYGEPQGPQRSLMGATKAALSRSAQNVGIGLTDDLPALAGAAFGFDDYARKQLEEGQKARERLNVLNPREVESYKNVDSFGKGATYIAETIGFIYTLCCFCVLKRLTFYTWYRGNRNTCFWVKHSLVCRGN